MNANLMSTSLTTADQWIVAFFNSNFGTYKEGDFPWGNLVLAVVAVLLSVVLCSFIGVEREQRGRSAGLRTHLLVGVGSAILMVISIYGFPSGTSFDASRIAAGVVSGVGFLGAGAIIHHNNGIKGLTTASTIWAAMAIGLACGSMNFLLAVFSTAVVMIVLVAFRRIEVRITRKHPIMIITAHLQGPVMSELLSLAGEFNSTVTDVKTQIVHDGNEELLEITCKVTREEGEFDTESFVSQLKKRCPAIVDIRILNHH